LQVVQESKVKVLRIFFIYFLLFVQLSLVVGLLPSLHFEVAGTLFVVALLSFKRPLRSLYFFIALLPFMLQHFAREYMLYFTVGSAALLFGIYANLLFINKMSYLRFLVKIRLSSIIIILILFYSFSLLFGLSGQVLFGLYYNIFIVHTPMLLEQILNSNQSNVFYPLKETLLSYEAMLFGLYFYGTLKAPMHLKLFYRLLCIAGVATLASLLFTFAVHQKTDKAEISQKYRTLQQKRLDMLQKSTELFTLNPIYGTGLGSFTWKTKKLQKETLTKSLNSIYLENIVASGIVGSLFFTGIIYLLFYKLVRLYLLQKNLSIQAKSPYILYALILFLFLIIGGGVDILLLYPLSILFWIVLFMGISFVHSYRITTTQIYRAKYFFHYIFETMIMLLLIHIANFTVLKKWFTAQLYNAIPSLQGSELYPLLGSFSVVLLIVFFFSIATHLKIVFFSKEDNLLSDSFCEQNGHTIHSERVPRVGGVGLFVANILLLFNPIGWQLLLSAVPVFIIGLYDDIKSISPTFRLIVEFFAALCVLYLLHAFVYSIGFGVMVPFWVALPLSLLAIVGLINAFNIIDGFNGLLSGASFFFFTSLATVSWLVSDLVILEIIVINIMALTGFFIMNFPKAKIFLGDSGAYLLGFIAMVVALMLLNRHHDISIYYPLALFIYPIFEVIFSILRRKLASNRKIMEADKEHLHQIIYFCITKSNPKTTLFILKRIFVFVLASTYFYKNDIALLIIILVFVCYYLWLYQNINLKLKGRGHESQ
jgi:UDP-N-acetylmuramyl pentapeptide phosphotransferase/UDP-N-acetylglucosamine-1-phosphate transferase